ASVSRSPAVFDFDKLAWMNRQYMKQVPVARIARDAAPYFVERGFVRDPTEAAIEYLASLLPMAVGSVDTLEDIVERVAFVFAWDADAAHALVGAEPEGTRVVEAFATAIAEIGPLTDRERFRAAVAHARAATGLKGRALLHPLRVVLTGAESGPELDIAVPAIEHGAALDPAAGVAVVSSCLRRLRLVAS